MVKNYFKNQKGISLFIVVLVVGIALVAVLNLTILILKQLTSSTLVKQSEIAYQAAESGFQNVYYKWYDIVKDKPPEEGGIGYCHIEDNWDDCRHEMEDFSNFDNWNDLTNGARWRVTDLDFEEAEETSIFWENVNKKVADLTEKGKDFLNNIFGNEVFAQGGRVARGVVVCPQNLLDSDMGRKPPSELDGVTGCSFYTGEVGTWLGSENWDLKAQLENMGYQNITKVVVEDMWVDDFGGLWWQKDWNERVKQGITSMKNPLWAIIHDPWGWFTTGCQGEEGNDYRDTHHWGWLEEKCNQHISVDISNGLLNEGLKLYAGSKDDSTRYKTKYAGHGLKLDIWYNPSETQPPTAVFSPNPASGNAPLSVGFDASASHDNDDRGDSPEISLYEYDCKDDGAYDHTTRYSVTDPGICTYDTEGEYTVRLRVTDNDGEQDETTRTVSVGSAVPQVRAGCIIIKTQGKYLGVRRETLNKICVEPSSAPSPTSLPAP